MKNYHKYSVLAIDMGGTKTNLGIFSVTRNPSHPLLPEKISMQQLVNKDYCSPEILIKAGLEKLGCLKVDAAVLAVAGVMKGGNVELTNLSWTLNGISLQQKFKWPQLILVNDLEAMAYGVPLLAKDQLLPLHSVQPFHNIQPSMQGTIALIAPGTGLGEAFLHWNGDRYVAYASEGGHGDFAPTDSVQIELLSFLMEQFDHVSYERICSGVGLLNVYRFLRQRKLMDEPSWLSPFLMEEHQCVRAIINAAMDSTRSCEICRQTVKLFVQVLGAETGNLALRMLPSGGLFIGGGLAPRIVEYFQNSDFLFEVYNKGRMTEVVAQFPIYLVLDPLTPLLGAAYLGLRKLVEA